MIYILIILIILAVGYYTLTYGIAIYNNQKNKLGGFAVILLAFSSTILSIIILLLKQR